MSYYARSRVTGDGVTRDFTVVGSYLDKAHIHAYLDNVETFAFTWLNASTIRFTSAPANGVKVLIKRITSAGSRLVDYTAGSSLNEADLDTDSLQGFYLCQETLDELSDSGGSSSDALASAAAAQGSATAAASSATASAASASAASTSATNAGTSATNAGNSATAAAASATAAASSVAALSATSTSSVAIATGSKAFTIQASKQIIVGEFVIIASAANTANYMHGQVTAYAGTTLTVNVLDVGGAGTFADWNIAVSGPTGSQGATGSTGVTGAMGPVGGGIVIPYTFSTTLTNSDPGNGTLRLDNATQNLAVAIRADLLDANGSDWTTVIDGLDDSTNPTVKGYFRLFKTSDPTKFIEGYASAVDASSGYRNITVVVQASSGATPFANGDSVTLTYTRAGDRGSAGAGSGDVQGPASSVSGNLVSFSGATGKIVQDSLLALDTDTTLAANSDAKIASQKAVKAYVDGIVAAQDAMVFKGATDCSGSPNYPAANRGDTYRVSVAGKIGGASGTVVEVGDIFICLTDSTASGNQATVGTAWTVIQSNIDGAVVGPASAVSGNVVTFNGTTGKIIQDGGKALPTGTIIGTTDTQTLTNKRVTDRVTTAASSATPTPNADTDDAFELTAQAAAAAFVNPTGTPTNKQKLVISIKDNGTARALSWGTIYRAGTDVALPTTTVVNKTVYIGFIYNNADTKWDLVAVTGNI